MLIKMQKKTQNIVKELVEAYNLRRGWSIVKNEHRFPRPYKLHLGCGDKYFKDWINIDLVKTTATDICADLTRAFPLEANSCQLIYSEHFLEHLPLEKGINLLKESYRVLMPGGVLRVATPSLDVLLQKSVSDDWRDQDWLTWPEHQFIKTRAEMLNIAFRWWGHSWLYDKEELIRRLKEAGFHQLKEMPWGGSGVVDLQDRESRKDSLLIYEAVKL